MGMGCETACALGDFDKEVWAYGKHECILYNMIAKTNTLMSCLFPLISKFPVRAQYLCISFSISVLMNTSSLIRVSVHTC
jgi:hypothetical protein